MKFAQRFGNKAEKRCYINRRPREIKMLRVCWNNVANGR